MSVFFLYPIFLLGLLAASLPVLIHLLNRRRLKRIRFPAVRFILLSQKRISRSYRLRHWILLALRTLAVVFLALLLANPIFQTGAGLFAGGGPVALVVLLDNSLSMTWSGDGNGFKQAKDAARLLISALGDDDRAAIVPTNITGKEIFRLKNQKDVLLRELDGIEIADGSVNLEAALGKAYELLNVPASQKEIRFITDLGLTGWDQFSVGGLKQVDPSIPFKLIHIGRKQTPLNGSIKEIRLGSQGVGANLPLQIDATVANFGDGELKDVLAQLSIDGQNKEQKLVTVAAKSETTVSFQTRLNQPGAHAGQVTLKKAGLAGNPTMNFTLDAQEKIKVLIVDGDPQTSLVQSETFFLSRALNPAGEGDSSVFLPTVILPDGLNGANLESFRVVILCNVATLPDSLVPKLQTFLRQGGGLWIFTGDKFQADSYNQKLARDLPGQLGEKKIGPEANGEKIGTYDAKHPALQFLNDPLLQESLKSARVWGYLRAGAGRAPLISLAGGEPLLLEQKIGAGTILLMASSADRDWTDLPLKTVYLPLVQSLAQYLAGGNRGALDSGIAVGAVKEITVPSSFVGKSLRITKPDKQTTEVPIAGAKDRGLATIEENDRAGIYRLSLPAADKSGEVPQMYAVNPPLLESRLDEISAGELQTKLRPIRADVIPLEALKEGGKRTDLALPLLALLIITLLLEGWLGQRF